MFKTIQTISILTALAVASALPAVAAPEALSFRYELSLDDYRGQPFLQTMLEDYSGVKAHLDDDYEDTYTITDWKTFKHAVHNFDSKIVRRVKGAFSSEKQMRAFVERLEGKRFKPSNIVRIVGQHYKGRGNKYALAHVLAMASGAGTLVRIDDENYYYNYGYKSGAHRDDVRSGRSYGATPLHAANDASCVMYLNELSDFLTHEGNDLEGYYRTVLEFLTRTDVSGYRHLNRYAQAAMTDYIAIYTAEVNRHIMVNLNPRRHPWENDLTEATFMALYSAETGRVMLDGKLKHARIRDYWAMSKTGSGRSGIGITRKDRRRLQRYVSQYMRNHHSHLVESVEDLIGGPGPRGDIFRGLMEYLNNRGTQDSVRRNAEELTDVFVELLMQVRQDAHQITRYVESRLR